ncbi:MAG: phenylalanine--tRNA ligase subunit beta [Candidatus Dasytiphilus stammeri]
MKFSEFWLREWVNIDIDSETLSEQLTLAGLTVDSVVSVVDDAAFGGKWNNAVVVIGQVRECCIISSAQPHKKLFLTKIDIGTNRLLTIFCSAENCRNGIKVAVAIRIGGAAYHLLLQTTPTTSSSCNIISQPLLLQQQGAGKNNMMRPMMMPSSYEEEGMLCSFADLGIYDDQYSNNTIIELPLNAPLGANVREYLTLNDKIIEINVTPNRSDCLSIRGLAREIAVLNKTRLNEKKISPVQVTLDDALPIMVKVANACPRYLARILKDVNINTPTPLWLIEKLRRCDVRSINIITDINHYILLELGQPMQIFDLDTIDGGISVRMAKVNENIMLMNGRKISLQEDTIVIADEKKILSLAGIISGYFCSVGKNTKNILLESALFNPLFIRGRALRYGLHSPISQHYERGGVDQQIQYKAIELATSLVIDICGGQVGPIIDVSTPKLLPNSNDIIILRRKKIDQVIGQHIADEKIFDILSRLGCSLTTTDNTYWKVSTPSWRFDLNFEEDLVEEIIRIYGYQKILRTPLINLRRFNNLHSLHFSIKRVKTMLVARGYQEVITYSFVNPKLQRMIHPETKGIKLSNPISVEMSVMRLSLWPGLISVIISNQKQLHKSIRIFEIGLRFIPNVKSNLGIQQDLIITGMISGNRNEKHWDLHHCHPVDFYDLKRDVEVLLSLNGKMDDIEFKTETNPALHPGQSAAIYFKGERIGIMGVIHPELEHRLELNGRTVVFELFWHKIPIIPHPIIKEISRFPLIRRDIAIVVSETIPLEDIVKECKKVLSNQLVELNIFDVYRGANIAEGYKSLAISIIIQNIKRTLKENEIATIIASCIEALKSRFQASLRD